MKPFADQKKKDKRTVPKGFFDALAKRALMSRLSTLYVSKENLEGIVWRVCVKDALDDECDPRWKAGKKFWKSIPLECDGKPDGVSVYETFQFSRQ